MTNLCYLAEKSCGGCCCIEVPEDNKEDLIELFRFRRTAYKTHLAGKSNIEDYEAQIATREVLLSIATLEETLEKKCHYLGFVDDEETKIGCLAHPEMNQGEDLRDQGFYKSSQICQEFFCPTMKIYQELTPKQQKLFLMTITDLDWYDLSEQDKVYQALTTFRDQLPQIEKKIASNMQTKKFKS